MALKIAIMYTILLIIEEYKGAQCAHDVLDEFNLMCYVTMHAVLLDLLNFAYSSTDQYGEYIQNSLLEIRKMNTKLHLVNGWTKYLNATPDNIYNEIMYAINNYNEEVTRENVRTNLISNYHDSGYEYISWTAPKVAKFFQMLLSGEGREHLINSTFLLCKNTLFTLSKISENIENHIIAAFYFNENQSQPSVISIHGPVLLLMTKEKINDFLLTVNEYDQKITIIAFVIEIVEDIYRGMNNILKTVNTSYLKNNEFTMDFNTEFIDIKLLRMLMQSFNDVIQLTIKLLQLRKITGVKQSLAMVTTKIHERNVYDEFRATFINIWQNKFGSEDNARVGQPLSTLTDGLLIKNNKVIPPTITYYTVQDELWESSDHLTKLNKRVKFLLELNAWIRILMHQLTEIKTYFVRNGYYIEINLFSKLSADAEFVMAYGHFFQTAT